MTSLTSTQFQNGEMKGQGRNEDTRLDNNSILSKSSDWSIIKCGPVFVTSF